MNYADIEQVSSGIKTMQIKSKDYAEVNQRIKAFRKLLPEGFIRTKLLKADGVLYIVQAEVGIGDMVYATGLAYEKEGSSQINKTSALENCETSAVGRALGMLGIGIDTSVCSADELSNALYQQKSQPAQYDQQYYMDQMQHRVGSEKATENQIRYLNTLILNTGRNDIDPNILTKKEAQQLIQELKGGR